MQDAVTELYKTASAMEEQKLIAFLDDVSGSNEHSASMLFLKALPYVRAPILKNGIMAFLEQNNERGQ